MSLNEKETKAVQRFVEVGMSNLTPSETKTVNDVFGKDATVSDVIAVMAATYPVPTDEERALATKVIDNEGMLSLNKKEQHILEHMGDKRASYRDVIDIVMSAYRNEISNRYRSLNDQMFLLQIIDRDEMVSKTKLMSLFGKLHVAGELSDAAYKIIKENVLTMDKHDMKRMTDTRQKAYEDATKKLEEIKKQTENKFSKIAKKKLSKKVAKASEHK